MKSLKDDRRSKRTQQLLGDALVALMQEKPYDDITVQDILDRGNIGRSTFYAHYSDKEDLLMSRVAEVFPFLDHDAPIPNFDSEGLIPSLALFRHAQEHQHLMRALLRGKALEIIRRDFETYLGEIIQHKLPDAKVEDGADGLPLPLITRFVTHTFLMLLLWWFEGDLRYSAEQINEMFTKLVMPGIEGQTSLPK